MISDEQTAFQQLTPDVLLDAVEAQGYCCDGRILALNSYENRVYQVGLDEAEPIVAKFYRPGRWSDEAIIEEHRFSQALADMEIPVVAPLANTAGQTLFNHGLFRFALYPRRGGRPPELDNSEHLKIMGRFVARIHLLGEVQSFVHRPVLNSASFGREPAAFLLNSGWIPVHLETAYQTLTDELLSLIEQRFEQVQALRLLRIHGDFHPGNILWRDGHPHIVDFDDTRMGPAVQDLWLFLSGDRDYQQARLADLLEGYTQFRDFDARELQLIEPLRTLRMIHYAAWLARRWGDSAFPLAFPWFDSPRYWEEHILSLREQRALLDEPPLGWF